MCGHFYQIYQKYTCLYNSNPQYLLKILLNVVCTIHYFCNPIKPFKPHSKNAYTRFERPKLRVELYRYVHFDKFDKMSARLKM